MCLKNLSHEIRYFLCFFEPSQKKRNLNDFNNYQEAYHCLMLDITSAQKKSTDLVLKNSQAKEIFVDGGFSKNKLYMKLIAITFPDKEVYAATVAQASALGSAIALHKFWNGSEIPNYLIHVKNYKT